MSAATYLETLGLTLSLTETGKLAVKGLSRLRPETRAYALAVANDYKSDILLELQIRQDPPPNYAAFCADYWEGCMRCPDCSHWKLRFCERYNRLQGEAPGVLQ